MCGPLMISNFSISPICVCIIKMFLSDLHKLGICKKPNCKVLELSNMELTKNHPTKGLKVPPILFIVHPHVTQSNTCLHRCHKKPCNIFLKYEEMKLSFRMKNLI